MASSVKEVFDTECKHLFIDTRFLKKLNQYQMKFVTKNQDHIAFFGGNLTGVHVVRFTDSDRDTWFDDILETDEKVLEDDISKLDDINQDFIVSSNTMNISCTWLAHAIFTSKHLNDHQKHSGMIDVFLVLQYKFLTSLLFQYFKYPAQKEVAEATYAALNLRFTLKEKGSWSALLLSRSEDIIDKHGIHYQTIVDFKDDKKIVYLINDTQGRIRGILKNYYTVFDQVVKSGQRISSVNAVVEHDGVEILRDRSHSLTRYNRYIQSVISDKESFIRAELTGVIERIMQTMPPKMFISTLEWMSANAHERKSSDIQSIVDDTLVHAFDYLSQNTSVIQKTTDLPGMLSRLRGVYMSSRSTDPTLIDLRERTEKIVEIATNNKNPSNLASTRTGVLLYIVLRTFTMKHYANSA